MEFFRVRNETRINIKIIVENKGEAKGELIRFLAPITVERILRRLPIEGRGALAKEEIYFESPLQIGGEKAVSEVESGTIAYWPMGKAICIFYGKTKPYSPVNRIGRIIENIELFRDLKSGTKIRIEIG
ncbi:MAG: uncharacterized protein QG670_2838 [Thermoproteota archaeon]|nr:uncharacterized protein [Thermoproteota archaeon]